MTIKLGRVGVLFHAESGLWGWHCKVCKHFGKRVKVAGLATKEAALLDWRAHEVTSKHQQSVDARRWEYERFIAPWENKL
jgi:hypothetical protein